MMEVAYKPQLIIEAYTQNYIRKSLTIKFRF